MDRATRTHPLIVIMLILFFVVLAYTAHIAVDARERLECERHPTWELEQRPRGVLFFAAGSHGCSPRK
jgi:hypothetical protein